MTLRQQIEADSKAALKAGDKERLKVLRLALAAVKQQEIDQRIALDEAGLLALIGKMVKQRKDSIAQFTDGGRQDLADAEQREIDVLEGYLPAPLSEEETAALIEEALTATGASAISDMGKVMGYVKQKAGARADLGKVSAQVKARLG